MPVINKIKSRINKIKGVSGSVIDASDKVWIHIILEKDANEEDVRKLIESKEGLHLTIESSYQVGDGILKSGRTVLKTHL